MRVDQNCNTDKSLTGWPEGKPVATYQHYRTTAHDDRRPVARRKQCKQYISNSISVQTATREGAQRRQSQYCISPQGGSTVHTNPATVKQ